MGFWDSGIVVKVRKTDSLGRDAGEETMVLKEGRRDGVWLAGGPFFRERTVRSFSPVRVDLFRRRGGMVRAFTSGRKDAWFLEIEDADGSLHRFALRNEADGRSMLKRIQRHM